MVNKAMLNVVTPEEKGPICERERGMREMEDRLKRQMETSGVTNGSFNAYFIPIWVRVVEMPIFLSGQCACACLDTDAFRLGSPSHGGPQIDRLG